MHNNCNRKCKGIENHNQNKLVIFTKIKEEFHHRISFKINKIIKCKIGNLTTLTKIISFSQSEPSQMLPQ